MGDDQQKEAAAKARLDQSAISRWLNTGTPGRAENVAAFARAYNRPVLEAFVAAGFLTATEAKQRPTAAPSLDSFSDDQLVEEVRRRMKRGGEHGGDTAATSATPAEVTHLPTAARAPGKPSKGQQRRCNADKAGEPEPIDPDDFEPR